MKTLKIFTAILALSLTTQIFAQEKTEIRNVTGFSGVAVGESIQVELTYGEKEFVEVTANEDYIERVATEIKGDNLNIYIKGNNWNGWNKPIIVKVTASTIKEIKASSSSSLISQNLIESENLSLTVSSSAHIKVAVKANHVSCKASSSGSIRMKGSTENFNVHASSSSDVDADELKALKVDANVSSSARVSVHAENEIIANASSSGSIKYSGSPKIVDIDKSSSGSVHKKD
ncbi:MAG: DUF2807 domain-containing protein [Salinivirgaceae bacterium]|jgi:hypothetical protein|nr:DUF2807 domain-containing protein [Salinivirgaceae bacterium]